MKSKVYFIAVNKLYEFKIAGKLKRLLEESKVLDCIGQQSRIAVKVHFGEAGNTGFVKAKYLGVVCSQIAKKSKDLFLSDTNTLYRGRRMNSVDHLKLAYEHGFTDNIAKAKVIIPDDTVKDNIINIQINQVLLKSAKVARIFIDADAIIAVSHFKGHMLTGFGGALKNIGMGCAIREGKLAQHCDVSPIVNKGSCIGCGACVKICPVSAIQLENRKAVINKSLCIGCANCIGVCPTMAMFVDIEAGDMVQKKMVEYTYAVLKDKKSKSGFINFAIKINKECDCWGSNNSRIADDIGIFASNDPVAIDKASLDLVIKNSGKDIFKQAHPDQDYNIQLEYAQKLGLGSLDYELVVV
jgi:uncharacterized protein